MNLFASSISGYVIAYANNNMKIVDAMPQIIGGRVAIKYL